MRIYIYAYNDELYISSKHLAKPLKFQGEFDTVEDAENFIEQNFYDCEYYVEKSIFEESYLYGLILRHSISSPERYDSLVQRFTFTTDNEGNVY